MSFKFRSRLTPLVLLGVGLFSTVSLFGCGGGDGNSGFTNSATRRATSTVNLSGANKALLDISVATDNTVSGTMKIDDGVRSVQSRAIVATYQLTGSIAANGDLNLTGTYTPPGGVAQTSRITGNLGATSGQVVVNLLEQAFTGTWTVTAVVTNPNPTGGSTSISFSSPSGTNATTTNRTLGLVAGTITNILGMKQLTVSASAGGTGDTTGTLGFAVMGTPVAGTFAIDDNKYQVSYSQGPLGSPLQWHASGGMLQIVSIDANKVSFKIIGATMIKDTAAATGTFTVDSTGETTALVTF